MHRTRVHSSKPNSSSSSPATTNSKQWCIGSSDSEVLQSWIIFLFYGMGPELLTKTLTEAHTRTCLYSSDQVAEIMKKPPDVGSILLYKSMDHEQLWLDCAQKLTNIIQQIIEFAKMVPGFMKLSQDDQILLLKADILLNVEEGDNEDVIEFPLEEMNNNCPIELRMTSCSEPVGGWGAT
ncbi:putative nuclear hormone receptor HR3 [Araneus ventricosus]|uniref:Putative nuclear hormone receptor HR3 n=1 Tax=Araneus ventricosus TaxID=182803 RepID=A0A4Y2MBC1_ARAVE|nr:putative nuclear hormone receptor HR3 [Araneus ventricosus]